MSGAQQRLRFVADLNPSKSAIRRLPHDTEVAFVPMEAVSETGQIDTSTRKPLDTVYNGYTYFASGDVLVAKITPCFENGKGAIVPDIPNGIGFGTTEFHVLRPKPSLDGRFLHYITRSAMFREGGAAEMKGAAGQQRVPEDYVKDFQVRVPSLRIQQAIANSLDHKIATLDALIEKKNHLISLLADKQTALIHRAVTKGLNPNVPMKDSGISWIGPIPAHWACAPLYSRYETQLGKMLDTQRIVGSEMRPYVRNADIQWSGVNTENLHQMDFSPAERIRCRLRPGDLLVCEGGANEKIVGRSAIWTGQLEECYFQKALHRIRPTRRGEVPQFLLYSIRAAVNLGVFVAGANPNTVFHLTGEKLRAHRFAFPPADEQSEVVRVLQHGLGRIETLTERVRQQIDRLREYRQALITAAVTGQLDIGGSSL